MICAFKLYALLDGKNNDKASLIKHATVLQSTNQLSGII